MRVYTLALLSYHSDHHVNTDDIQPAVHIGDLLTQALGGGGSCRAKAGPWHRKREGSIFWGQEQWGHLRHHAAHHPTFDQKLLLLQPRQRGFPRTFQDVPRRIAGD